MEKTKTGEEDAGSRDYSLRVADCIILTAKSNKR